VACEDVASGIGQDLLVGAGDPGRFGDQFTALGSIFERFSGLMASELFQKSKPLALP